MQNNFHRITFLKSKALASFVFSHGALALRHLTGTNFAYISQKMIPVLDLFEEPCDVHELVQSTGLSLDTAERIIRTLASAKIIQASGEIDESWIEKPFTRNEGDRWKPEGTFLETGPAFHQFWTDARGEKCQTQVDVPSLEERIHSSSAILYHRLKNGNWIVTHVTRGLFYLTHDVVQVLKILSKEQTYDQWTRSIAGSFSNDALASIFFSLHHLGLIIRSSESEEDLIQSRFFVGNKPLEVFGTNTMFEQSTAPLTLDDLSKTHKLGSAAFVGQCQINSLLPSFRLQALFYGWCVDAEGFTFAELARLKRRHWSMIALSPQEDFVSFYRKLAVEDYAGARNEVSKAMGDLMLRLVRIRKISKAPIFINSLSGPSLQSGPGLSRQNFDLQFVLAEANAKISRECARFQDVFLLDEVGTAAFAGSDLIWDDPFHHMSHHTNAAFWTNAIHMGERLDSGDSRRPRAFCDRTLAEGGAPVARVFPDELTEIKDTAGPFASLYAEALERSYIHSPIEAIVFEPNGLLWPGDLRDRDRPYPKGYFFAGGADAMMHLGINEALLVLFKRGARLFVCTELSETELREKWENSSSDPNLVQWMDVHLLAASVSTKVDLDSHLQSKGLNPKNALWIHSQHEESFIKADFSGKVFQGDSWKLKRFLYRFPPLYTEKHAKEYQPMSVPHEPLSQEDYGSRTIVSSEKKAKFRSQEDVLSVVLQTLSTELKIPTRAIGLETDLRTLGVDSVRSFSILAKIEDVLSVSMRDEFIVGTSLFSAKGLANAFYQSQNADFQSKKLSRKSNSVFEGITYETWCSQSLVRLILERFREPTSPWAFKIVRSVHGFDYEYVPWRVLGSLVGGYLQLFQNLSLKRGDAIALLLPQGKELMAAFIAGLMGGYVPSISAFPSEKLSVEMFSEWFSKIIAKSRTKAVVCYPEIRSVLESEIQKNNLKVLITEEIPSPTEIRDESVTFERRENEALFLQYSSGTTGVKKAVTVPERKLLSQLWSYGHGLDLQKTDRIISWVPLYHDMGLVGCFLLPFITGVPTVMMSPFDWVKRPRMMLEQFTEERGTISWMPNFAFFHCARLVKEQDLDGLDLSSVRILINGSEPITWEAFAAFFDRFSRVGLSLSALTTSYGMAEATLGVSISSLAEPPVTVCVDRDLFRKEGRVKTLDPFEASSTQLTLVSSGRPLDKTEVEIIDENGNVLGEDQVGEIQVRGASILNSYFEDPEASGVFQNGNYRTGDMGFLHEGELFVSGRKKDMVIVSGHNIYTHDIEQAVSDVSGIYPGRVVAFGVFDDALGTERLVIVAETKGFKQVSEEERFAEKQALKGRIQEMVLANFNVVVSDIVLKDERTLIKSTSGKISRTLNRDLYLEEMQSQEFVEKNKEN